MAIESFCCAIGGPFSWFPLRFLATLVWPKHGPDQASPRKREPAVLADMSQGGAAEFAARFQRTYTSSAL
jgi:hypothetical protein